MDKLCKYIDKELEEMEEKVGMGGKLSRTEIEDGKNLAKFKMALLTNEAMEEDGEYSGNYSGARGRGRNARRDSMGRYSNDGRMMPDQRMDGNYSFNRRGGYSYDDAKEEMIEHLHEAKKSAPDDETRRMIDKWIKQAEND